MTLTDSPVFAVCMMVAGLAAGVVWYALRLKKNDLPPAAALIGAAAGSVLALLLAKAGYLLHDLGANLIDGYYDEITELIPEELSFACGALGIAAGVALSARLCGFKARKALDLFAELLETAYVTGDESARESISAIRFYLHNAGIDVVDYVPGNESWFVFLPASKPGTMRPALASEGQLIKKGLASK